MDESYFDNGNPLQNTTFLFQKKKAPTIKNNFFLNCTHYSPFVVHHVTQLIPIHPVLYISAYDSY